MIRAFSDENRNPNFDWDRRYGPGFDVVDLRRLNEIEAYAQRRSKRRKPRPTRRS
jgi:hypothetical protein